VPSQEFKLKKDYGKYFGAVMMLGFGVLAFYRWQQTHLIFFLLLVLRDFAAGYFFLIRKPSTTKATIPVSIAAYVSAAIPLMYFQASEPIKSLMLASDLLAIFGFLLVAVATLELGESIGITPANRGLVRSGIYRRIKHPMYLGYVISEVGLVLLNPLNIALLAVSVSLYIFRAMSENKILKASI